jgi:hypothetical protein
LTGFRVEKILSGLIDDPEQAMFLGAGIAKRNIDRHPRWLRAAKNGPISLRLPKIPLYSGHLTRKHGSKGRPVAAGP